MSEELKPQSKIVSLLLLCMQQHSLASNYILLAQSSLIGAVHMLSMRLLSLPSTDIWATPSAMAIDTLSCQLDEFLNGDSESPLILGCKKHLLILFGSIIPAQILLHATLLDALKGVTELSEGVKSVANGISEVASICPVEGPARA